MKKIILGMVLIGLAVSVIAQRSQRRIYLWDVTLSMFGEKCPGGQIQKDPQGINIYDDVVKFLSLEIESITDESTEIIVLPFQTDILVKADDWKVKVTDSGKREIINKIKTYPKQGCSWTDIVRPIDYVQTNIIKPDKNNLLILLTDGVQSESRGGIELLKKKIYDWGDFAKRKNAFCLYVMFGEGANEELEKLLDSTPRITKWLPGDFGKMQQIDLQPAELLKINIKDDKTATIPLTFKKSAVLPNDTKIMVKAKDSILNIEQEVLVKDGQITFDLNYRYDYEKLKTKLDAVTRLPLQIEIIEDEMKNKDQIIYLTKNDIELELINKPEKTLRIRIK